MIMKKKYVILIRDTALSGDNHLITNEAKKILKYKNITKEIQLIRNVKNERDTNNTNNMGNWNHPNILQKRNI